ncbi:amidohydrolase family protein [Marinomonas colpomeniae]|uniref:Amidohydrolase family protein n=1 Tax=Marinomonas colpomeniae TaxID=2774408 RepID=A0ABR8NZ29_9GAMM|nr:amidohydrolase family protein [Marinomonas colpomeniae]MBD5770860.1 amidohydrolase family protein [Marinomonas colpomeniae]
MRIDAHQHFWNLQRNDYGWLTPELTSLYKNFLPSNLAPLLKSHNIDGTILVQAAPTNEETEFLLQLSEQNNSIKGVVGWVDFDNADASKRIMELAKHSRLIGLRPMIQDIDDVDWMLRSNVAKALQTMTDEELVFDALVMPKHLPNLKQIVEQNPNLSTVINHAAKPNIKDQAFTQWHADICAFSEHQQVSCKLSGLVTEAKEDWQAEDLYPYMDTLFDVFGHQRIIWGSDWPVCLLASSYATWIKLVERYLDEKKQSSEAILGANALRIYKLESN